MWIAALMTAFLQTGPAAAGPDATFESDVEFLEQHADVVVLRPHSGGVIAVSPKLSGRVMTSAFEPAEPGFGLVNREAILAGPVEKGFANYGGEDRIWFAPEGGPHALYFEPGDPQDLDHWFVPVVMDGGPRTVSIQSRTGVTFRDEVKLGNVRGATFELSVERQVYSMERHEVEALLDEDLGSLRSVAFRTIHNVAHTGSPPSQDEGLLSVWILGQFNPAPGPVDPTGERSTHVYLPFLGPADAIKKDYFGVVPDERLTILTHPGGTGGTARFRADSELRSKIGIPAAASVGWLGAFDPVRGALTLVHHTVPEADAVVPDCRWKDPNEEATRGDVATSYNNGGPPRFFELESISEALPAKEGATLSHSHVTIHLDGDSDRIRGLARRLLGADL